MLEGFAVVDIQHHARTGVAWLLLNAASPCSSAAWRMLTVRMLAWPRLLACEGVAGLKGEPSSLTPTHKEAHRGAPCSPDLRVFVS